MGLYSNTRVDSLNEYASEEFKRTVNVESLIEACIEIRENDYKMFESLLNLDFAEASMLNEADNSNDSGGFKSAPPRTISAKEEDKKEEAKAEPAAKEEKPAEKKDEKVSEANKSKIKNIWDKIVKFFETVIEKIKAFFNKVATKIGEVIRRDKAITEKYKDAFTEEKIKGFPGISDFSAPAKSPEDMKSWAATQTSEMDRQLTQVLNGINSATTKSAIDTKVEQFTGEEIPNVLEKEGTTNSLFTKYEGDKKFVPSVDWMKTALASIGERSKVLEAVKSNNAEFEKKLNAKKAELKSEYNKVSADKNSNELALAKAAGAFKLTQSYSRKVIKVADNFVKVITKAFGAYRKAVLIVGKYCLSEKKEKANASFEFNVMDFAIAEASDLYIAESLGY